MSEEKKGNIFLSVADDYSKTPGARFEEEGPHSAERFLQECVIPKFEEARARGVKLIIDLDRTEGYATSFLQGTFGTLAHDYSSEAVFETVEVISDDDPYLHDYIERYIKDGHKVTKDTVEV